MSTIVCQNLVSSFDTQLTETTTTLKLKVVAAPHDRPKADFGNWGFLQTGPYKEPSLVQEKDNMSFYTNKKPSYNSSFSRLSPKSLELCTENLGSETGSDTFSSSESCSIFSSSSPHNNSPSSIFSTSQTETSSCFGNSSKPLKKIDQEDANSCRRTKNFPPPLTSMSGSSSLQVLRHREGGRLIIEAVEAPFRNSYLQAERSDGRLRLCFLTGEEEHEEEDDEMAAADEEEKFDEPEHEPEYESDDELEGDHVSLEMGMEKFQWLSRCKEGSHGNEGLCSNWKPALWVATS